MRGWYDSFSRAAAVLALGLSETSSWAMAYNLDVSSHPALKDVAKSMAEDLVTYYHGNEPGGTPGLLPEPYYWWEGGAFMGALIDYWYYTGDDTYNDMTQEGMLWQVGTNNDYMPSNQTLTEGNDDQGFWGMAVMSAAELNFQNPPDDKPQWLALAQAVFNTQAARWETADCGGGLRWQIFTWNNGWDYKNSISQACFFNIASRLALYTGNQTYADWAERTWDWMTASGLLSDQGNAYHVYDGIHTENCSDITPYQWTYNVGAFLLGSAAMYNHTSGSERDKWRERVDGLLNGTASVFFHDGIMVEIACETVKRCNNDEQSFKAYLSRWMAATTKWAPWTYNQVKPLLESSAVAAAAQCTGGDNGRMCGLVWTDNGTWDGSTGVGQQMAAMEVVLANLINNSTTPVTNNTGGTSAGDPSAGSSDVGHTDTHTLSAITTADRAGAGICTVLLLLGLFAGAALAVLDEGNGKTPRERWADFCSAAMFWRRDRGNAGWSEKGKQLDRPDSDASLQAHGLDGTLISGPTKPPATAAAGAIPVEEISAHYQHRSSRSGSGLFLIEKPTPLPVMTAAHGDMLPRRHRLRLKGRKWLPAEHKPRPQKDLDRSLGSSPVGV